MRLEPLMLMFDLTLSARYVIIRTWPPYRRLVPVHDLRGSLMFACTALLAAALFAGPAAPADPTPPAPNDATNGKPWAPGQFDRKKPVAGPAQEDFMAQFDNFTDPSGLPEGWAAAYGVDLAKKMKLSEKPTPQDVLITAAPTDGGSTTGSPAGSTTGSPSKFTAGSESTSAPEAKPFSLLAPNPQRPSFTPPEWHTKTDHHRQVPHIED
ncbi:hypothetical protein [Planotetraspora sp. GP83]|uniref:hypothetical protein n=1 Tax=Planotetraspora sp. GP83 TaxID=3156264 RepID=UPI0035178094